MSHLNISLNKNGH